MENQLTVNTPSCGGIYKKLAKARAELALCQFRKSGKNAYAGFDYYELKDFMPDVLRVCNEVGICGHVMVYGDMAVLKLVDVDDGSCIEFKEELSSVSMGKEGKGPQPIQLLGALITYHRRYLWMTAMELSENDTIDASEQTGTAGLILPYKKSVEKLINQGNTGAAFHLISSMERQSRQLLMSQLSQSHQDSLYESPEYKNVIASKKQDKQQTHQKEEDNG